MIITDEQKDVLSEWVNIAFGRAAGSLSDLLGQRIFLKAPQVIVLNLTELYSSMEAIYSGQVVMVHQNFNGGVSGDILLFFDYDSASVLIDLLCGGVGQKRRLTVSDREALVEVGNILLNAYIGSFGNLIAAKIKFGLPSLSLDHLSDLRDVLVLNPEIVRLILLVKTNFSLLAGNVTGYIGLVLEIDSVETLLSSIQNIEDMEE